MGRSKDVDVRRAVAAAIDRNALGAAEAREASAHRDARPAACCSCPASVATATSPARELKPGRTRPARCSRKAGYAQKDGKAVRDGKPLTLTLPVPSDTPTNDARVKAIVADLKAVGITVKTPTVEASRFFRDTVVPLDFDLVTFTWPASAFPVQPAERRFRPVDSPENYTGVAAKNLNGPWGDASAALDDDERADRIHDLDARLMREAVDRPAGRAARCRGGQGRAGQLRRRHVRAARLHDRWGSGRSECGDPVGDLVAATASVASSVAAW